MKCYIETFFISSLSCIVCDRESIDVTSVSSYRSVHVNRLGGIGHKSDPGHNMCELVVISAV